MSTTADSLSLAIRRPAAPWSEDYVLDIPDGAQRRLARAWLWMGLAALMGSGLFAVLLVLSRTPGLNVLFPAADFFRLALVVHVDLSVLVWFSAMAGMLWSLNGSRRALPLAWVALTLCGLGALAMSLAPFIAPGEAIMANYVPMLDSAGFAGGLLVFGAGVLILVVRGLVAAPRIGIRFDGAGALRFGLNASVVAAAVALLAFGWSLVAMPPGLSGKPYYEVLYWGGGHALQFTWTLLMLVGWLWLATAAGARPPLSPRVTLLLFAIALASVFVTPYAYLAYDIASVEHRDLHTLAMRFGGGLSILPIALAIIVALVRRTGSDAAPGAASAILHHRQSLVRRDERAPLRSALIASLALFGAGGIIGVFISGNNVRIPAHYHGSIVGVTLALMGLVYYLLPRLGYAAPRGRLARLQPMLYGAGQLMHIVGLVWSGGYGVQRKVAGAEQVLRSTGEVAGMGLMGFGGLIAIIGGVLFVVVVIRAARASRASGEQSAAHCDPLS